MSLLQNEKILVKRRTASGSWSYGKYTDAAETVFYIYASVQPLSDEEILRLPELERTTSGKKIYSEDEIRTNDIIVYKTYQYKVFAVKDYNEFGNPKHYKATCLLIEEEK